MWERVALSLLFELSKRRQCTTFGGCIQIRSYGAAIYSGIGYSANRIHDTSFTVDLQRCNCNTNLDPDIIIKGTA